MTTWAPILIYLSIIIWSGVVVRPLCRLIFQNLPRVPFSSISLTVGTPVTLTAFSLIARLNPDYAIAVPVLLIGGTVASVLLATFTAEETNRCQSDVRADIAIIGTASLILLAAIAIRTNWPSIYWNNISHRNGSEKLFNLSMIQAFAFGKGFPPENIWNLGEPINYYILLHSLPGLTAWGVRILTGDPTAGSTVFVFSDCFLLVWGSLALITWSYTLLGHFCPQLTRRQALIVSISLGIGVSLSVHASAVIRVMTAWFYNTSFGGWRSLQNYVIAWTVAQYPVWTLIQGDHHAFQRVFFIQVSLISSLILLLGADRFHPARIFLTATLAAAVLLAHPGSVMIDLLVGVPAGIGIVSLMLYSRDWKGVKILLINVGGTALVAGLLSIPRLLELQPAVTNWYWVDTPSASPLGGFLSVQSAPLLFFVLASSTALFNIPRGCKKVWWYVGSVGMMALSLFGLYSRLLLSGGFLLGSGTLLWPHNLLHQRDWRNRLRVFLPHGLAFITVFFLVILSRPAAAIALTLSVFVMRSAPRSDARALPIIALGSSLYLIWLLPEFIVVESPVFGEGPEKRFNVTMRFWLEGYYLIPLMAILLWSPCYPAVFARRWCRSLYLIIGLVVGTLWTITHGFAVADRISTTGDKPGIDGGVVLSRLAPRDAAIVKYLQQLPDPVHIGELCGTGEVIPNLPSHYDWPGRIAAFSARPGMCGWSRHVWQVGVKLSKPSPTGPWSWVRFREYERQLNQLYTAVLQGNSASDSAENLATLGITHLVVGEGEQLLFPALTAHKLGSAIGGAVIFEGEAGTGVVLMKAEQFGHKEAAAS